MQRMVWVLCLGLLAAGGCAKVKAAVCGEPAPAIKAPGVGDPKPGKPVVGSEVEAPEGEAADATTLVHTARSASEPQERFALPFAWEKSPTEPLARTRAFLREVVRDNDTYMQRGPAFFKAFANQETPRATVIACADSRVQPAAWDASPENDDFSIRNIGNQVGNGLGSIEYGVEQLQTPLLVVLGHTGCGAVKAAMGDLSTLSEPIRRELLPLKAAKTKGKTPPTDAAWRDAVLKNVHDQVEHALGAFASRVNAGQLTVVGAVYDFRNDLGKGPGRVSIINVNGVKAPARLKSFEDAVMAGAQRDAGKNKPLDPFERLSQVFVEHMHDQPDDEEAEDEPSQAIPLQAAPAEPAPVAEPAAPPAAEAPKSGTIRAKAARPRR
jgi:carbonic anhydrase